MTAGHIAFAEAEILLGKMIDTVEVDLAVAMRVEKCRHTLAEVDVAGEGEVDTAVAEVYVAEEVDTAVAEMDVVEEGEVDTAVAEVYVAEEEVDTAVAEMDVVEEGEVDTAVAGLLVAMLAE